MQHNLLVLRIHATSAPTKVVVLKDSPPLAPTIPNLPMMSLTFLFEKRSGVDDFAARMSGDRAEELWNGYPVPLAPLAPHVVQSTQSFDLDFRL